MRRNGLPRWQYTARDVRTDIVYLGYSVERSLINSKIFIQYIAEDLKDRGVDLTQVRWQTDNGNEFIGSYNAKRRSAVTMVIEDDYNSIHNRIPPSANTYNSDVETFHRLIEDEIRRIL
jgi:hypothetical protein